MLTRWLWQHVHKATPWRCRLGASHQSGKTGRIVLITLLLIIAHTWAMMYFEGLNPEDALWLTLVTVTTVGYGDFSAETPGGRIATIIFMLGGIYAMTVAISLVVEHYQWRRNRQRQGLWNWHMKHHVLIVNAPAFDAERYLKRLMHHLRHAPGGRKLDVAIITEAFPNGLPESLLALGLVHHHGRVDARDVLLRANADSASTLVILAEDERDQHADAVTFSALCRLRELNTQAYLIAECVTDEDRERFNAAGASTVIRPIRAYPEMLVRSITAEGSASFIENLLSTDEDELVMVTGPYAGRWGLLVKWFSEQDLGLPVAGRLADGQMKHNPAMHEELYLEAVLVLISEAQLDRLTQQPLPHQLHE
ncbi:hypothetical protein BFW38_02220 [Terasakiispira papahanaumokuakeensis]|uniref:Potassium channel domain-containing protein n=1 Tax=Terasakiispira papahanaumokuakeensis TaxID=197479 RepID=A0A1E2V7A5_9GAMM|nr:potassium channel family protein [Terasakiispira papahanaumokuakeensis]ODC02535.1 hypothetical protein BFW38_02220 [Terasakiispira papahanaumokuakeensis]